jgi:hypothetical protein
MGGFLVIVITSIAVILQLYILISIFRSDNSARSKRQILEEIATYERFKFIKDTLDGK